MLEAKGNEVALVDAELLVVLVGFHGNTLRG